MCGICGCGQTGGVGSLSTATLTSSKVENTGKLTPVLKQHRHVLKTTGHHHGHEHHDSERLVKIEQDLLSKNNAYAAQNRRFFQQEGIFVLNLVSSPGAGKTTLLVETIKILKDRIPIAVIEGDQQTEHDADKIRATGVPALQINTGRACHLDAHGIGHAVMELAVAPNSLLAIENVGNLVCPSSFDLGEAHKVVVLSVTEGDDKPLKYPDMFHAADVMILNKTDLLPYVDFDVEKCLAYAKQVNPDLQVIQLSATKGDNFAGWIEWLLGRVGQGTAFTKTS